MSQGPTYILALEFQESRKLCLLGVASKEKLQGYFGVVFPEDGAQLDVSCSTLREAGVLVDKSFEE